jgi:hypothetical protein
MKAVLALVGLCLSVSALRAQQPEDHPPQPRAATLQQMHAPTLTGGNLPTYYSRGSEARARQLQEFIADERAFYRQQLGVALDDLQLAVLNPAQWQQVSAPIPYGMPSVEGHPRVVVMPADWSKVTAMPLPKESDMPASLRKIAAKTGRSWNQLMYLGADEIGAHEVGHAILEDYGIDAQVHWFNEFLASYVGVVFVDAKRPADMTANRLLWNGCLLWPHPHTSLHDLDAMYDEIMQQSPTNYGWYQCAMDQRVLAIHHQEGIGFLKQVKREFPIGAPRLNEQQVLDKLETLTPGWKAWASHLQSGEVQAAP